MVSSQTAVSSRSTSARCGALGGSRASRSRAVAAALRRGRPALAYASARANRASCSVGIERRGPSRNAAMAAAGCPVERLQDAEVRGDDRIVRLGRCAPRERALAPAAVSCRAGRGRSRARGAHRPTAVPPSSAARERAAPRAAQSPRCESRVAESQVRLAVARVVAQDALERAIERRRPRSSPEVTCAIRAATSRRSFGIGRASPAAAGRRAAQRSRARGGASRRRGVDDGRAGARPSCVEYRSTRRRGRAATSAAAPTRWSARRDRGRRRTARASAPRCTSTARSHRAQRRPAELDERRERLGVELALRQRLRRAKRRRRDRCRRHRGSVDAEQRASTVGATSASVTGVRSTRVPAADAGAAHDQRHPQRRVVDEDAVADLAVLAERLAVIAGDDDERVRDARAERGEQPAGLAIRGRRSRRRSDRSDRPAGSDGVAVGRVRLEEVHPQEEGGRCSLAGWAAAASAMRLVDDAAAPGVRSTAAVGVRAAGDRRRRRSRGRGRTGDRAETRRRTPPVAKPCRLQRRWRASGRCRARAGRCRARRGPAGSGRSAASRATAA